MFPLDFCIPRSKLEQQIKMKINRSRFDRTEYLFFSLIYQCFIFEVCFFSFKRKRFMPRQRFCDIFHPEECQLYYDCSLTYANIPRSPHFEQRMVEYPYPSLFFTQSFRCENFTNDCCGIRKELKDKSKNLFFDDAPCILF